MLKIEKEIKNTLYIGVLIVIGGVYCLLSNIINIPKNDFEFVMLCIFIVVGLSFATKSLFMSGKIEKRDELIRYAEGKADQVGFNCVQSLVIISCALCSFMNMVGITNIKTPCIGYICMILYGALIIVRNAYLLKILHKDE